MRTTWYTNWKHELRLVALENRSCWPYCLGQGKWKWRIQWQGRGSFFTKNSKSRPRRQRHATLIKLLHCRRIDRGLALVGSFAVHQRNDRGRLPRLRRRADHAGTRPVGGPLFPCRWQIVSYIDRGMWEESHNDDSSTSSPFAAESRCDWANTNRELKRMKRPANRSERPNSCRTSNLIASLSRYFFDLIAVVLNWTRIHCFCSCSQNDMAMIKLDRKAQYTGE